MPKDDISSGHVDLGTERPNKALYREHSTPRSAPHLEISDSHYASIGKIVDAWADLEFEIDRAIWMLLKTSQPLGACVTSQLISVLPKLDALRSLVGYWGFDEKIRKSIAKFQGDLGSLVPIRNRKIHDKRFVWGDTMEVVQFVINAKSKLTFEPVNELENDLENLRKEIFNKLEKFFEIKKSILDEMPSLRKKLTARRHNIMEKSVRPKARPKKK